MRLRPRPTLLHDAQPCAALMASHSLENKRYREFSRQLPSAWKQRIRDRLLTTYRAFEPGTQRHLYTKFCVLQLRTAGERCRIRLSSLLVVVLLASFVLMPACGSSNNGSGGGTGTCTAVPGAPTGLAASNTTAGATTLNWTAPTGLAADCSVTGYTIYENGNTTSIGTSTTTSFNVTGLSPSTPYSFTVAASDAAGLGAQSSAAPVTTAAAGTGTTIPATMTWDGVTRYYQVYVPSVLRPNPPMLLMLHGTRFEVPPANPSTLSWGWQSVADQYEFIEVQPASTYNANSGQWNWNAYFMDAAFTSSESGTCTSPPATSCPDDAGFLRQLILNLTTQYNVNPKMIFVAGMSSGAQMAERVGVEISDLVAAIGPTSGQLEGQQSLPPPVMVPGSALAPISVQEWHGTADTELPPCNNGPTAYSGVTYYLDTVDDTFNYWVSQNQCSNLQTTQTLCTDGSATSGLSGNIATGCTGNNIEVQFIWEEGIGHTWEESDNNSRWLFLSSHPKQ